MAWNVRTNVRLAIKRGNFIIYNDDSSLFKLTTDVYNLLIPYVNDIDFGDISAAYSNNESGGRNYDFYNMERLSMTPYFCDIGLLSLQLAVGEEIIIYNPDLGDANALVLRAVNNYGNAPLRLEFGSIINGTKRYSGWYRNVGLENDNTYGTLCIGMIADPDLYRARFYVLYGYDYSQTGSSTKSANLRWFNHSGYPSPSLNEIFRSDWYIAAHEWIPPTPPTPSSDPYADGGTSTPGGGEGSFDDASDEIDVPGVPALNLSLNHFISTYAPTVTQLNDLADFMWADWLSTGPTLAKIFADPSDAIISLHMLPFTPATATAVTVTIGSYSTGVSMDPLTLQFYTIDCGELAIAEYWGNYLDYNPYTKLTLFLPYVGEITLNPDEVMGQTIGIKYRIDALTGAFVCFVTRADKKILGEYQGNCALEVPISSANYAQLHSALLGLAGTAVAAGAAGITGGVSSLLNGAPGVIKSAAGVMDSKVRHSHGGSLGSAAGFMGSQKPYLIIERARQCLPERLNEFAGYPSQVTATLGDQSGFTSVSDIILDGIPLTDGELTELREILKGGIYV